MASARVQLGLSNQEFIQGLNEATNRARGFESTLGGLFRRSPTARAERAFTELAQNLSTGDVAQSFASFATRLTGLGGLFAGAAIGAGVLIFQKLSDQIKEAAVATAALNAQIDKPHNVTAALGVAGITSELQKTVQLTDQLIAKTTTFGARLKNAFSQGGILGALSAIATIGRLDIGAGDLGAALSSQLKLRQDLAKSETDIADIREKALIGSEKQATLDDISRRAAEQKAALTNETLEAQNKISQILEEDKTKPIAKRLLPSERERLEKTRAALGAEDPQRLANIEKIAALERIAAADKFDNKSKELDIEKDIAALSLLGLSTDDQKIIKLKAELALLQEQLKSTRLMSDEARKALQAKETQTKSQLGEAQKAREAQAAQGAQGGAQGPPLLKPIGILGATPKGIYDPNLGEFRTVVRPQEQAALRAGEAEAMAKLRDDKSMYESQKRNWLATYQDYLRGADYYSPEQLQRPKPSPGYEIDPATGRALRRPDQPKTQMTKDEYQQALDAVMGKYWGP